jgi:hypothetical protein
MSNRFTVYDQNDQVAVNDDGQDLSFSGPNGMRAATRACARNGGGIVRAETPLDPSGESAWSVAANGSFAPLED